MEKVEIGIEGLDKCLEGGIPKGNVVLVSGGAGTGKSTLCLQYLMNGAKNGEKSLYITTEQTKEELYRLARGFGWDLERLERRGMLEIFYLDILEERNFITALERKISEFNPDRIAIDSMTTLTDTLTITDFKDKTAFSMVEVMENVVPTPMSEKIITKNVLYSLIGKLRKETTATVILTSELRDGEKGLSADGVSEFICDGVIVMHYLGIGGFDSRSLVIRKMRYTNHQKSYVPYEIMHGQGVVVHSDEAMAVLMK